MTTPTSWAVLVHVAATVRGDAAAAADRPDAEPPLTAYAAGVRDALSMATGIPLASGATGGTAATELSDRLAQIS